MASSNPIRTWILTGSVAAITATGAWYGAGLKTRQEYNQDRGVRLQATPAERIEQMEIAKTRMLAQKAELQSKIDRLSAREESGAPSSTSET
ncbi:hypothetical protein D0869_12603 [Hortaea werneckii]|uniref:Uncharacterized protein n=1 Tax=Hortaea werneckii TaxID=91943 RepID=A0A3M6Y570_HORWE|nr:hypothetical protein D0869_12603 [Hortaea werneckii]RMX98174.1 hypothetical protein D0868_10243 [Hortaea werneckii]